MIMAAVVGVIAGALFASHPTIAYDPATQAVRAWDLGDAAVLLEDQNAASRVLRVYLGDSQTAMLGDYRLSGKTLSFTPRFRFLPGRDYRALLDLGELTPGKEPTTYRFRTPATAA